MVVQYGSKSDHMFVLELILSKVWNLNPLTVVVSVLRKKQMRTTRVVTLIEGGVAPRLLCIQTLS